jgi:hypothetical protein
MALIRSSRVARSIARARSRAEYSRVGREPEAAPRAGRPRPASSVTSLPAAAAGRHRAPAPGWAGAERGEQQAEEQQQEQHGPLSGRPLSGRGRLPAPRPDRHRPACPARDPVPARRGGTMGRAEPPAAPSTPICWPGLTIINAFFENSTRTLLSFEIAGKRLGADVVNMHAAQSSVKKGETLIDTAMTLNAMRADAIVIRHGSRGGAADRGQGRLPGAQCRRRPARTPHAGAARCADHPPCAGRGRGGEDLPG